MASIFRNTYLPLLLLYRLTSNKTLDFKSVPYCLCPHTARRWIGDFGRKGICFTVSFLCMIQNSFRRDDLIFFRCVGKEALFGPMRMHIVTSQHHGNDAPPLMLPSGCIHLILFWDSVSGEWKPVQLALNKNFDPVNENFVQRGEIWLKPLRGTLMEHIFMYFAVLESKLWVMHWLVSPGRQALRLSWGLRYRRLPHGS